MGINGNLKNISVLIVISLFLFMIGNGILNLTNPDEVFYAQTAKEMMQQRTWVVPYLFGHPQFEKPILTFWLLRIGFILFGISNFSARFFPALFAILGVIAVYFLALLGYRDKRKAFISALILLSCGLYIALARTLFTDMIFSVLVLLSLASFFWAYVQTSRKGLGIILFFAFCGLATLTKGPLGLIIPFLAIFLFLGFRKDIKFLFCGYSIWGFLIFTALAFPWYWFMIKKFGNSFTQEFFYNDHIRRLFQAEHKGNDTWYFYPGSMLACMFPWSAVVFMSFFHLIKRLRERSAQPIYIFVSCWILAVFAIFQIAHSKLVSYILPLVPALAMISGDFISGAVNWGRRKNFLLSIILWLTLVSIPIGVQIAAFEYPEYSPPKAYVYGFMLVFMAVLTIMLFFSIRRKLSAYLHMPVISVFLILFFVFSSQGSFDAYTSSKSACSYLLKNNAVNNTILCSKFNVRGVRYFSDKDVAVFGVGSGNFFSPHPISFLDSEEKIKAFLSAQKTTYCILTKSSWLNLQRICSDYGFKAELLKIIGEEYVARAQSAK